MLRMDVVRALSFDVSSSSLISTEDVDDEIEIKVWNLLVDVKLTNTYRLEIYNFVLLDIICIIWIGASGRPLCWKWTRGGTWKSVFWALCW
jgi:hypothetical protein